MSAKRIMTVRRQNTGQPELEEIRKPIDHTHVGGVQDLEQKTFFRVIWFIFGVLSQTIKLMACSGIPWTQTWACFYLGSFFIVEVMMALDRSKQEEVDFDERSRLEYWLTRVERTLGVIAELLQLTVLATVDLAEIPPDPIPWRRWKFRVLRLSAHVIPITIYVPFILSDVSDPLQSLKRRIKSLFFAIFLINIVLTTLSFLNYRFSHLYFLWSIVISTIAWLLIFFPETKTHVLMCEEGSGNTGYRNVLVFDFFCRIVCFSMFWYIWYYDPHGTLKPSGTNNLG